MRALRVLRGTLIWAALLLAIDMALWGEVTWLAVHGLLVPALMLAYPTLSLFAVVCLYAWAGLGANPGALLKGERSPWLQPLFFPFRAVAWLLTLLARLARRGPPISPICPGVYMGVRLFPFEAGKLDALGVRCVVDLCAELPTNARMACAPFIRLQVPVLDRCPPLPEELERATDWIAARLAEGEAVYIHCAFGRGRSALVAAAALLRLGVASHPDDALTRLVRARPVVHVRGDQYAALVDYAARLAARDATNGAAAN